MIISNLKMFIIIIFRSVSTGNTRLLRLLLLPKATCAENEATMIVMHNTCYSWAGSAKLTLTCFMHLIIAN